LRLSVGSGLLLWCAGGFLLRRLGGHKFIRFPNQGLEFAGGQHIGIGKLDPLVTADVGSRRNAFDFEQLMECFRGALERQARETAVGKNGARENLAADLEAEIVAPWHVLDGAGEREAKLADPVDIGHAEMIAQDDENSSPRLRTGKVLVVCLLN